MDTKVTIPDDPIVQAWERYAAKSTARRTTNAAGAATWLNWTQYPDHGPTESILGPLRDKQIIEGTLLVRASRT